MKHYALPWTLLILLLIAGCQAPREEGRAWIFPRPAAALQLTLMDSAGNPIEDAAGQLLFGGERLLEVDRFVGYDPNVGVQSDAAGLITLHYLGETGGGYEVPLDAPAQPRLELALAAPGMAPLTVNLDRLLFRPPPEPDIVTIVHDGQTIELPVVSDTIVLQP